MAFFLDSNTYSRKSHRHGTSGSGRRRTTTSYDKYGYQVATYGSSSFSTSGNMHILRVQPGVVVNFIDPPSSSSRNRTRPTTPRAVEHKSSGRKSSHSHRGDDEGESSWSMTHSPHPRALELFDDRGPPNTFGMMETTPSSRDPMPIARRSSDDRGPSNSYGIVDGMDPCRDPQPNMRRSPPSHHSTPEAHYPTEPHYPVESHYAVESHYPIEPHDSPRHTTAPIDIPIISHSPEYADYSLHSPSISSTGSPSLNYNPTIEPYYHVPRRMPAPIEMPMQMSSSGRNLSRSFEYPSPAKPPSPASSSPSNTRTVRFNEDPVLPSPHPVARRKGWWNRRGDQLWDNDGGYALASDHDKYPLDLHDYPEPGTGWMNEEGTQIDTKRRIVRKKPLRSALKKSSSL